MNKGWQKSRFTGGSLFATLECGHTIRRKLSDGVPKRANCRECRDLRNGAESSRRDLQTNRITVESWDADTGMPKRVTRPMTPEEIREWDDWSGRSDEAHRDDEARREADRADREAAKHDDRDPPE